MTKMKDHGCHGCYSWLIHKPIFLQPSNKPIFTTFSKFRRPRRSKLFLLLLAICSSLSIFRLRVPPLRPCTSDDRLLMSRGDDAGLDEFWKQPGGIGLRPCLNFSDRYLKAPVDRRTKRKFLMVVVYGGLNQQRNQIVDAVVMARILEAILVLPILHVDQVWGDESEFSDIFDDGHFKETLKDDVHVVSSLPSTHLRKRPLSERITDFVDEHWIRRQYMRRLNKHGLLLLRGMDSRLSENLSPDLQKLRCKVALQALKFRPWIEKFGEKLAERMAMGGLYLALHLQLEKDVWLRTGCLSGLGEEADRVIELERASRPELQAIHSNITGKDRRLAGLCPLNAIEISRLLKGLGATKGTRIFWAGGEPFGGSDKALKPLQTQFPYLYNKWSLAKAGELDEVQNKSSVLAALDYMICLKSHVFMANHNGSMARSIQGHRAFLGHTKHITLDNRRLVQLFMNKSIEESEMEKKIKKLHIDSLVFPFLGTPIQHCICSSI